MKKSIYVTAIIILFATGCASTRSISNSGYEARNSYTPPPRELNEFDVLGIEPDKAVSEEDIAKAGERAQRVALKPRETILLVQSGSEYPDGPMVSELQKAYHVVPFTGVAEEPAIQHDTLVTSLRRRNAVIITDSGTPTTVPLSEEQGSTNKPVARETCSYSRFLRLAAARAGADTIVCYWGIVESENERMATKTFSWLPGASWFVPDEREHLRIRIKMALVDVHTGSWTVLSPEPIEASALSASSRREVVDQKQVETLKARAYHAGAVKLLAENGN